MFCYCILDTLASDRVVWKTTCEAGLAHFVSDWLAASEERRAARHTVRPQQNQRQVHSVLTAAEPVPPSLDCRVTCMHVDPSTTQQ